MPFRNNRPSGAAGGVLAGSFPNPRFLWNNPDISERAWQPAGAISANSDRRMGTPNNTNLVSGVMRLAGGLSLYAGTPVRGMGCASGGTAAVAPTNQWFALIHASTLTIVAITADYTNEAWAADTVKRRDFAAGVFIPSVDMDVYGGFVMVAGTPINLKATSHMASMVAEPPVLSGNSTVGLTTPLALGTVVAAPSGVFTSNPYFFVYQ